MPWAAAAGAAAGYVLNATDPLGGNSNSGGGGNGAAGSIWGQSPEKIASIVAAISNAQNANPTDAEKQQLESLKRANEISSSMWQRYQQVYQPLQDKVIQDATNMDSASEQDRVAGVANADVTGAFERTRQSALDRLRSLGVNPSSGAFIEANTRLAGQEAGANAGLQNAARTNLINQARTARSTAAGVGTNIPNQAMSGFQTQASGLGSAATGIRAGRATDNSALGGFLAPVIGGAVNWFRNQNSTPGTGYGSNDSGTGGAYDWMDSNGDVMPEFANGGVVRGPRGYADGGKVSGPGNGTSDSVPVAIRGPGGVQRGYLSDGEYVVPADVVRAKGVEFFNKMIEQYHTPVRHGVRR